MMLISSKSDDRASQEIWRGYSYKCDMSYKTRNGTIACGVVDRLELVDPYSRPEFVAEHEGRSAYLLSLLYSWNPVIADEHQQLENLQFMLMHDGGERIGGDALDDGSGERKAAQALEKRTMYELFECYPEARRPRLMDQYKKFESYSSNMAFPKAVDKIEAVLWQIYLYKHGRVGYVSWKRPPSGRDLRFGKILGTYRAMDVWCLHYRVVTWNLPEDERELLDNVLKTAFRDACGKLPYCMTINVADIPLDLPEDEWNFEILDFPEDALGMGIA